VANGRALLSLIIIYLETVALVMLSTPLSFIPSTYIASFIVLSAIILLASYTLKVLFGLSLAASYVLALCAAFWAGEHYSYLGYFFAVPILASLVGIIYCFAELEDFSVFIYISAHVKNKKKFNISDVEEALIRDEELEATACYKINEIVF
jgi:hypothetical protein